MWRSIVIVIASLVLLVACGGSEAAAPTEVTVTVTPEPTGVEPTSPPNPTSDPAGVEALAVVEAFDPSDETAGIISLNELVFNDGEANSASIVPSLAPLLADEDATRRWAAIYVVALLTDTDAESEVLQTVLDDPELSLRVEAAGSLVGLGVVEALPVLIEGLDAEWDMPYSHPPISVAEHARTTLEYYTGQTFTDAAGWQSWWDGVKDSIRWDGERYVAS